MKIADIYPEDVIALYKQYHLKPINSVASVRAGRTCLVGILGYHLTGTEHSATSERIATLQLQSADGWLLTTGFDDGFTSTAPRNQTVSYLTGHEVGKRCKEALEAGELDVTD